MCSNKNAQHFYFAANFSNDFMTWRARTWEEIWQKIELTKFWKKYFFYFQFNKFHDVRIIFFLNNLHTIIMFYQIRAKKSILCFISKNISKIKTAVILLSVFLLSFSALITELIQFIINANFIQLASSGLLTIEYKFELPHERS